MAFTCSWYLQNRLWIRELILDSMNKKYAFFLILYLVGVFVLAAGCTTQTPPSKQSTELPVAGTTPTINESDQNPVLETDTSAFDLIEITIHRITVQNPGTEVPLATFDISLRNNGIPEGFSIDNRSLVLIAPDYPGQMNIYPKTEHLPEGTTNTIFPLHLAPGQEARGIVVFPLLQNVHSGALYVKYPNWTIAGEQYIPEIANGALPPSDQDYKKTLGMSVDSAVQMKTIPGMNLQPGVKIAIINVSITNHADTDATIRREQLFILTERGGTFEHGGDRLTREMAAQYLRFPLHIQPGETLSGPVLYIIYSGTRTNKLVLIDNNGIIQSMADLNTMYRYELEH
jgi:hypothetical protein